MAELPGIDYRAPEDVPRRVPRAFVVTAVAIVAAAAAPLLWATALTVHYQRVEGYGAIGNSPRATVYRYWCVDLPRTVGRSLTVVAAIVGFIALLLGRASAPKYALLVIPLLLATLFVFNVAMFFVKDEGFP